MATKKKILKVMCTLPADEQNKNNEKTAGRRALYVHCSHQCCKIPG